MPEYLTPGVYFEFLDTALAVQGVRTDIAGFVGLAERGPLHQPVRLESWRQFQAAFGSFVPYGFLAYAVKGFFENGGRTCYVVRIAGEMAARATLTLKNRTGDDVIRISAKNEGMWGNQITVLLQTRPAAREFSLVVTRDARDRESFPHLSIDADDSNYFVRVIAEGDERTAPSRWVDVEVPAATPSNVDLMPDAAQSQLDKGAGLLAGGLDGIASLTRDDFIGDFDVLASNRKGLSSFARVDEVAIIAIPDIHIQPEPVASPVPPPPQPPQDPCIPRVGPPPTATPASPPILEQPPSFSESDVFEVQRSMIEHCETLKDRVAVLDAPIRSGGRPFDLTEIRAWRSLLDSQRGFGALYYPWVKVVDPLRLGGNPVRAVPPSGHIAGLYARGDLSVGVHKAPANGELFWAEDVTLNVNDEEQGVLNPESINCVRAFPSRGIRVYGARTLSSDSDWRYVNVRRLLSMIEEALDESTQWAVFEPHNFVLRQTLNISISSFLSSLWRAGALVGATAEEAYYVKCDDVTNPPDSVAQGKIIAEIGVAPTHPAEFIVFRIGRTVAELEIVER